MWMIAYCGPRQNGTWGEIRESARTRSEEIARRVLAKRLRQVANHRDGLADFEGPSQRRSLVTELLQDLLAEYHRREIKGYDRTWYRIRRGSPLEAALGSKRVDRLTTDHVVEYTQTRRKAGKSKATVNRDVELLGAALRLALQRGKIARAPRMPVKLSERDNVRKGFFEISELETLLPHLPTPIDEMARFGFATGWRLGELLGLTWEASFSRRNPPRDFQEWRTQIPPARCLAEAAPRSPPKSPRVPRRVRSWTVLLPFSSTGEGDKQDHLRQAVAKSLRECWPGVLRKVRKGRHSLRRETLPRLPAHGSPKHDPRWCTAINCYANHRTHHRCDV